MHKAKKSKRRQLVQWLAVTEDTSARAEGEAAAYGRDVLRLTGG